MKLNLILGKEAWNHMPQPEVNCLEHAAHLLDKWITNHITVDLRVGWDHIDGQPLQGGAEGRFNYTVDSAGVALSWAQESAMGLAPARPEQVDGYVGFGPETHGYACGPRAEPGEMDFTGICLHELTEAMGRRTDSADGPDPNPGGYPTLLDTYRYTAPGELATDNSPVAYFSMDDGTTDLCNFNTIPTGDFGDWAYPGAGIDAFRGGITDDTISLITPVDQTLINALGFTTGVLPWGMNH